MISKLTTIVPGVLLSLLMSSVHEEAAHFGRGINR